MTDQDPAVDALLGALVEEPGEPPRPLRRERVLAHQARLVAIALCAIVVAYHYSLTTLLQSLGVDTPLAYLGLVPAISLLLVVRRSRPERTEPHIHDRQVDYIVGTSLLALSLAMCLLLPVHMSTMFWVWRVDLLAFPLFCAGTVTLLFGVRVLWRYRLPLLFLFLAWPLPYTAVLLSQLQAFTSFTLVGVRAVIGVLPVAHAAGGDPSLFSIGSGHDAFTVSVASACSGVNGLVGYALVAVAFLTEVRGPAWRKALWLTAGLALTWVLNVTRIVMIFTAGALWGQGVAIDALHPVLGLVTFNLGVLAMILLLGRFGLDLPMPQRRTRGAGAVPSRPPTVTRPWAAIAIVVVVGILSGFANSSLRDYDLVATSFGAPRLSAFIQRPTKPVGWRAYKTASFDWAKTYFGDQSRWYRYEYQWDGRTPTSFQTHSKVIADVISTTDRSTFSTYGIEACYQFHGYSLRTVRSVELGGVEANVVSYYNASVGSEWTSVYWHWPVQTPLGTRYERVTLMMTNSAKSHLSAAAPNPDAAKAFGLGVSNALRGGQAAPEDARMRQTQDFLVAFASDIVAHQPRLKTTA